MFPYIDVKTAEAAVYDGYRLTPEEIEDFLEMLELWGMQYALDSFLDEVLLPPSLYYQQIMSGFLSEATKGIIKEDSGKKMFSNIAILSLGLSSLLFSNYEFFLKRVYLKDVFKKSGLTNPELKRLITNDVLKEFEIRIANSIAQSQSFVTSGIRGIQREMIAKNLMWRQSGIKGGVLQAEMDKFKSQLEIKYPKVFKAMKEGNILVTRNFVDGKEIVRHYKVDYYVDLLARTNVLNADRKANVAMALASNESVVEYYLSDPRSVKKDREICQDILHNKISGISLLALNEDAGTALGIMTVDEAQNTPDYAMGPYCRHSIRRVSDSVLGFVNALLKDRGVMSWA